MCGRYSFTDPNRIREKMLQDFGVVFESEAPRYNVAPSQLHPVLAAADPGPGAQVQAMRWGLVPFWDKAEKPKFAPINARSEEMLGKPTFRQCVQKRRCLVPADGFYEWQRLDERTKIPHFIGLTDREPFYIAGIFELPTEHRPATFALLTTGPNDLMTAIHDRMPVIMGAEAGQRWIAPGPIDAAGVAAACRPYPAEKMRAVPVSSIVNSAKNDVPECIIPAI